MKLLRLKIKNIHSLKGEHVIDFSQGPLAESGLFAITGPTGAGKSTLLDAITLALFNKIPRFAPKGTENLSKTEIDKAGSIITHHTDEAWAEVEYQAGAEAYRSTWKISRARTGNLKDYEMTLAKLSETHNMDLKKSEIPAANERNLGLKYEQFIRSIVLAQGDFARLLKSDEKERAKLLEDITGSHIYREIGRTVYEKAKEADLEISTLKQEAALISILTEEQLIEKEDSIKKAVLLSAELEARIQVGHEMMVKLRRRKELNTSLQELTDQWTIIQEQKKASETKFAALQLHMTLLPLSPTVAVWKQAVAQRDINEEAIKNTTIEKTETSTQLEQSLATLSSFIGFEVHVDNYVEEAMRFSNEILDMDRRISGLKEEGIRYKNMMDEKTKDLPFASIISINRETDRSVKLSLVHARLEELEGKSTQPKVPLENIPEEIKRLQLQLEGLFEKAKWVDRLEKIHKEVKENKDQIAQAEKQIEQRKADHKNSEKELIEQQQELDKLSKEKEKIFKQSNLDELRLTLSDGDPCPLCGSLHHPYGHQDFASGVGSLEIKIQVVQRKLELVSSRLQQVNTDIGVMGKDLERCKIKVAQLTKEAEELKEKVPENLSSEVLQRNINTLKEQIRSKEIQQSERVELAELTVIRDFLEKMQVLTEQIKAEQKQLKNRYSGENIHNDVNSKISNVRNLVEKKNHLQAKVDTLTKEFEKALTSSDEMREKLRVGFLQTGIDTMESGLASILDDAIAEEWMQEKNMMDTKEVELQTRLEDTRRQLTLLQNIQAEQGLEWLENEIKELTADRDRLNHEIGAIRNEVKVNQASIALQAEKERRITQKIQENEALYNLNALIGDAQGVKFAKFAQNISLRTLLRHANTRLTEITDRYRLVFTDIDADLTVEDLYQGNTCRSVKTLSGGETFMVSLAMALSLSDMASSKVQLESIFIDEGFGTLDMETLEAAIITLEKLQAKSRKTIGIISHVPLLKERIHTQVMLKKNNLGYSEIEIKG